MSMRTRDLLNLRNTGHQGINALFAKAHSADWDIERDVDWTLPVRSDMARSDATKSPPIRDSTRARVNSPRAGSSASWATASTALLSE